MMTFVYVYGAVILIGVIAFVLSLFKEIKESDTAGLLSLTPAQEMDKRMLLLRGGPSEPPRSDPFPKMFRALTDKFQKSKRDDALPLVDGHRQNALETSPQEKPAEDEPVKKKPQDAEHSGAVLEDMLSEKSKEIERLKNDLESERAHRQEFEHLKDMLQQQIMTLKEQNRQLKADLDAASADTSRALPEDILMPRADNSSASEPSILPQNGQDVPVSADPEPEDLPVAKDEDGNEVIPGRQVSEEGGCPAKEKDAVLPVAEEPEHGGLSLSDIFNDGPEEPSPVEEDDVVRGEPDIVKPDIDEAQQSPPNDNK